MRGAQKRKRNSEVVNLFTLLGTMCVKAVRKTLMKLSPSVNFINILAKAYMRADPKSGKRYNFTEFLRFCARKSCEIDPKGLIL
jgi:hypothetical protein